MSPEALIFPISHFLKDLSHSAMAYNIMGSRVATFDPVVLYNIHRWKTVDITFFVATQQTM